MGMSIARTEQADLNFLFGVTESTGKYFTFYICPRLPHTKRMVGSSRIPRLKM